MITTNGTLKPRQKAVLNLVRTEAAKPVASLGLRDIMARLSLTSTSVVSADLKALEDAGYIRLRQLKANHIELVQHGPTPAEQVQELLALIAVATADIDRLAGHFKRRDPQMHQALSAIAASLRESAAEVTGTGE